MENIIYVPKGKAREYSPYALNIYNGCDHDCRYCYVKTMPFRKQVSNEEVRPRKDIIKKLEEQLKKHRITEQVLLSFTGDPYCKTDVGYKTTREILKILLRYDIPVAILSKGGKRILRDIDLFKQFRNIKIGTTLTLIDPEESLLYEPGASSPMDRRITLKTLYDEGIMTWVSFEPVIKPEITLELLEMTKSYIDQYKVGKMNHYKLPHEVNWQEFGNEISTRLLGLGKDFYIKKDLYKYMSTKLEEKYINQDYLMLRKNTKSKQILKNDILQPALF